jgi:hypothetical protein
MLKLCPKLPVGSIEKSVWFYIELLGLTMKKLSNDVVDFLPGICPCPGVLWQRILNPRIPQFTIYRSYINSEPLSLDHGVRYSSNHSVEVLETIKATLL